MVIDRRRFVGFGLALAWLGPGRLEATSPGYSLLSCRSDLQGRHFLTRVDREAGLVQDIQLPTRGHGMALAPDGRRAAVFARRPGDYVWVVDLEDGEVSDRIEAPPGRHYYGHGVFSNDGSLLLCSENAYETGQGVIGLYDLGDGCRRIGEVPSHGVGPHEIRLLSDGETLVVANGGIRTHPDLPRVKSNLANMQPSLAYVDFASGRLLHDHRPPSHWHQLSIRHIDVSPDDRVAVAMQFEGRPQSRPPLIALQQGEGPLQMLLAPQDVQGRLRNYCGSVTFSTDGSRFAVSSPRGGVVTLWSAQGDYLGLHQQPDACGISRGMAGSRDFLVSDGRGQIVQVGDDLEAHPWPRFADCRWDNHMLTLPG